jgi:hypothetical protein
MMLRGDIDVREIKNTRTNQQNKAYQKGCEIAAARLNEGGWTRNKVFQIRDVQLSWSRETFQTDITKPFMDIVFGKDSSTKLDTVEMSKMWNYVRDQIIKSTTESDLGPTIDIGPFPSLR